MRRCSLAGVAVVVVALSAASIASAVKPKPGYYKDKNLQVVVESNRITDIQVLRVKCVDDSFVHLFGDGKISRRGSFDFVARPPVGEVAQTKRNYKIKGEFTSKKKLEMSIKPARCPSEDYKAKRKRPL